MTEGLLSPVYDENINPDNTYVTVSNQNTIYNQINKFIHKVDKLQVAYALGIQQGTYKVNPDKLDNLRLTKEEQSAPPPPPKPLATKFEPNLSNKLMECSNDSIDLDGNSKDVETEDEKKVCLLVSVFFF